MRLALENTENVVYIEMFRKLMFLYEKYNNRMQFNRSMTFLLKAVRFIDENRLYEPRLRCRLLTKIGLEYYNNFSDFNLAIEFFHNTIDILSEEIINFDKKIFDEALTRLIETKLNSGQLEQALKIIHSTIEFFLENYIVDGYTIHLCITASNLYATFIRDYENAIRLLKRGYAYYVDCKNEEKNSIIKNFDTDSILFNRLIYELSRILTAIYLDKESFFTEEKHKKFKKRIILHFMNSTTYFSNLAYARFLENLIAIKKYRACVYFAHIKLKKIQNIPHLSEIKTHVNKLLNRASQQK